MRLILILIIPILLTLSVTAQDKRSNHEQIEALKTAWMANKLKLTPDEAQEFWPVYNNYEREMRSLYEQKRKNWYTNKDNPQENLRADLEIDGRILATKKKYQREFQAVIPAQKVLVLYRAEPEFREYLIKQMRNRGDSEKR